ncbi:uncharacterized protein ASCRUDRAFT_121538 [Ascoidea rubescens DSM 1968]|uniref:GIT Spa2 homology (SHD) domain-containing protein n=1 Tax=Ascoidea rubescens DSM 1968 TaxID=1344418 RepID=A0A1D2VA51_9ASCO|nr:hypothetical protein ASCRUDRAFT_121538 [Ascoidea rubescens DSM 1968]ODV58469.1 hypothetical protein ASCRUDRAFT_121538 [Ascoidea rubescens DSM 1968]
MFSILSKIKNILRKHDREEKPTHNDKNSSKPIYTLGYHTFETPTDKNEEPFNNLNICSVIDLHESSLFIDSEIHPNYKHSFLKIISPTSQSQNHSIQYNDSKSVFSFPFNYPNHNSISSTDQNKNKNQNQNSSFDLHKTHHFSNNQSDSLKETLSVYSNTNSYLTTNSYLNTNSHSNTGSLSNSFVDYEQNLVSTSDLDSNLNSNDPEFTDFSAFAFENFVPITNPTQQTVTDLSSQYKILISYFNHPIIKTWRDTASIQKLKKRRNRIKVLLTDQFSNLVFDVINEVLNKLNSPDFMQHRDDDTFKSNEITNNVIVNSLFATENNENKIYIKSQINKDKGDENIEEFKGKRREENPKENAERELARSKLSVLSRKRFNELAFDILVDIKQRGLCHLSDESIPNVQTIKQSEKQRINRVLDDDNYGKNNKYRDLYEVNPNPIRDCDGTNNEVCNNDGDQTTC